LFLRRSKGMICIGILEEIRFYEKYDFLENCVEESTSIAKISLIAKLLQRISLIAYLERNFGFLKNCHFVSRVSSNYWRLFSQSFMQQKLSKASSIECILHPMISKEENAWTTINGINLVQGNIRS
jgi:hypothetical protein